MRWFIRLAAVLALTASFAVGAEAREIPRLVDHVNDYSDVLTEQQEAALEASLVQIETYGGNPQVVILTVPSLEGEDLEGFSLRVAREWELGQAEYDNGLLLLVVTAPGDDFQTRFEVGRGLEGAIPDAMTRAIYVEAMRPHFQDEGREDYFAAFTGAVALLDPLIRGESTGRPAIDNAVQLEADAAKRTGILFIGGILAFILGYVHWGASGVVGTGTGLALGLVFGQVWWIILLLAVLGFPAGVIAHFFGRGALENAGSGGYGGGSSSGSFGGGGGGWGGGGGSFGGGGGSFGR